MLSAMNTRNTAVRTHEYQIMMISEPVTVVIAVIRRSRPVCMTSLMRSRSLVTLLSTSPGLLRSKKRSGRRWILPLICLRSVRLRFSATDAIR